MKADNNEFRRAFWNVMVNETTATNPVFGRGFGYDFRPHFEVAYGRGEWEGLRSPHNYFVTVYGRMGLVGLGLISIIAALIVRNALSAARAARAGRITMEDFSYWCGVVMLLIAGTFGVVLEGPMGAIPFWTFLGLALSAPSVSRLPQRDMPSDERTPELHRERAPARAA
jgi:O-antigen ligase